jgi:hypothetical protein
MLGTMQEDQEITLKLTILKGTSESKQLDVAVIGIWVIKHAAFRSESNLIPIIECDGTGNFFGVDFA